MDFVLGFGSYLDSGIIAGKGISVNILDKIHNNYNEALIIPHFQFKANDFDMQLPGWEY
jgi:hypothetical protein